MAVGTVKLATYNTLAEAETWDVDPGGVGKPPPGAVSAGAIAYTNVTAVQRFELSRDGDQNLPIFFTAGVPRYLTYNFTVAYSPALIAIINHNCFEVGDRIEIWSGATGPTVALRATITAPDRSVDKFYPLRFNDCWYNSGAISDIVWRVYFIKASGGAYVGEIFFASTFLSFIEWDPQPRPPITFDYQKNAATAELQSGSLVEYEIEPPFINIGLDWGRKVKPQGPAFFEHQAATVLNAASHSPYKQVLVLYDDRVCVFGRLEPNGSYQQLSDESFSPSYLFRAEYPRKFWRSFLVE